MSPNFKRKNCKKGGTTEKKKGNTINYVVKSQVLTAKESQEEI